MVTAARAAGLPLLYALATPEFLSTAAGERLVSTLETEVTQVASGLLKELADADSPRGLLAVVELPRVGLEAVPVRRDGVYVYLDGLQDPGNLGAVVRVAEAFAATAVVLAPGCAHPNHSRALRASAGSLLRCPLARDAGAAELDAHLAAVEPVWLALAPRGGRPLSEARLGGTLVIAVGAEGPGLSPAVLQHARRRVTIPLSPAVESLNAVVAAAIVLYETRRRRSATGRP